MKLNHSIIIILCIVFSSCKSKDDTLFKLLDSKDTNITFNNLITESDSMNILDYEYIYNGGGVALADFNNDGLDEVFFTGNMVSNALYLNKGKMKFEDISKSSKIYKENVWCTGVNIVDINQDGLKDIYVTVSTHKKADHRKNLLYVNESKNNQIIFSEKAKEYGIADTSYTMNSAFFDYDNDGDLDLFIINNRMDKNDISRYSRPINDVRSGKVDKLFRNDFNDSLGHAYFTDVSQEACIIFEGYSLGINICDINKDGWKDIYICNDFLSNDLLYINNQNGTFSNKINDYVNHTCFSAMGNDIVDINNDGLSDIIALDMLPNDNYRKKTMMGANNYSNYIHNNSYNYTHQLVRNVLQLNRGNLNGHHPSFSEIANVAGIQATDWSWAPLVADFDADGNRDIIITNGFPKDITDKDFMDYQSEYGTYIEKEKILLQIPEVKLKNYAYKNTGNLSFDDVTSNWGITKPSFSNGAAYGDLDNDGDLDYVVNNINDLAHLYENKLHDNNKSNSIKINLKGEKPNLDAIGAVINYKTKTINSTYMHQPGRGYLSSMSPTIYIGLGKDSLVDLEVIWPDNSFTNIKNVKSGTTLSIIKDKTKDKTYQYLNKNSNPIFLEDGILPRDTFTEIDNIDYNYDPLLIKKLSDLGPGIAVGNINNDGLDDYYIVGNRNHYGKFYIQKDGKFISNINDIVNIEKEELAPLFIDIDNDGDDDLYIGCGSNEFNFNDEKLKDVLLINDAGKFKDVSSLLPIPNINTACVKGCDYDNDGDIDLFIGGKAITHQFPKSEASFILRNDTKNKELKFTLIDAPFKDNLIMTSDALWTDYNNDGWTDLIVVGEFSDVKVYNNKNGILKLHNQGGIKNVKGLWNSINGADLDNDGDMDYVLGNYGQNSLVKASEQYPFRIYAKDFDNNSSYDFIPTTYWKNEKGIMAETPYHVKGDLIKELIGFRKKYVSYSKYALAPIDSIITPKFKTGAYIIEANHLSTSLMINNGEGKFTIQSLPIEAQFSTIYGTQIDDFNNDGFLDIMLIGNNYGSEQTNGRMDANYGTLLIGNGNNIFTYSNSSGLVLRNDSRAIAQINCNKLSNTWAFTSNNGAIKSYTISNKNKMYTYKNDVKKIVCYDKLNKRLKTIETYYGNSYLSQSSKTIYLPLNCDHIELTKRDNKKEVVNIN